MSSWAKEQTTRWWNGDVQQSCVHFTKTAIRRGATDEKAVGGCEGMPLPVSSRAAFDLDYRCIRAAMDCLRRPLLRRDRCTAVALQRLLSQRGLLVSSTGDFHPR